ncbi:MAG TPA: ATP-binding protein [Dehalococcoidia bacterium]|nr:ATP-binding protein [Dehalococcoidia bacterium]
MKPWHGALLIGLCGLVIVLALEVGGTISSVVLGVSLTLIIAGFFVAYYVLRPLGLIAEAMTRIARGDFSARVWPRPSGPTGELSDAVNSMAEHVQEQVAAASQERRRLAAALNSSIDAVAALDASGRILFANVAFEQAFGRNQADIAGKPFAWVLADEQVLDAIRASREHGLRQTSNVDVSNRQFLQVVTTPITGGGEWSVLVVCHDLTDVKRTEQVRRDFVANVSHELRTPLSAIKSVVETLAEGALHDETVALDFLRRADQEVDRLVLMVEELLELSRIESGEQPLAREEADVAMLLSDAIERLRTQAEHSQVELRLELAPDLGRASIDASRIERAVLNLVQNALKFTSEGGVVTLAAQRSERELHVEVRDTGIGIAQNDLPRIFERFYKADHSRASVGSGLGLALVKHAVEAHGGRVSVSSVPGQGSVFGFTIPV